MFTYYTDQNPVHVCKKKTQQHLHQQVVSKLTYKIFFDIFSRVKSSY